MRIRHLATAAVLVAGGLVVIAQIPSANAASACTIDYHASQWSTGFTADVKVTNGAAAVTGWKLTWTFAGDQQVTAAWGATVTQSGARVSASNAPWNGAVATGANASFGFQATYSGSNAAPTDFALNGVACGAPGAPTSAVSTASSAPTASVSPSTPTTSTSPSSSPSSPTVGCGTGALCDGFENQAGGTPGGDWAVSFPDCSGTGTASIDHAVAHSGSTSLRVDGAAGYCNHVFVGNTAILAKASTSWYVRYWVRHTTALPVSHTTAVAMRDANDANKDLRFGGQNAAMQYNRQSDDATLPEQSPAGVALSAPLPVDSWNCVELQISGADGTIKTWLNGTAITGLTADGVPSHDIDGQWQARTWRPKLTDLRLGWESYASGADTLWYDDVAVGSQRTGC